MAMNKRNNIRLPPEVNRVLYVRNLPYKITSDEMYDIFGKFGAIRQIRTGNTPETRELPLLSTRIFSMPRMPVIICLDSMFVIDIW
uniref:RRM domain-containing protein n=1 Tax=Megaselia scalaris TaxID=36166 RepID=T1GGL9_MEGSC